MGQSIDEVVIREEKSRTPLLEAFLFKVWIAEVHNIEVDLIHQDHQTPFYSNGAVELILYKLDRLGLFFLKGLVDPKVKTVLLRIYLDFLGFFVIINFIDVEIIFIMDQHFGLLFGREEESEV